jgi:ornithine carbamoyltransferase
MGNSLMVGAAKMGIDFRIAAPKSCQPEESLVDVCRQLPVDSGANITITDNIDEAVDGADAIYTDVWVSMGEDASVWESRVNLLRDYQVNAEMMSKTGKEHTLFMHCLPAFHNTDTEVGKQMKAQFGLDAMEVTEEVFEGPNSVVFDEAENRLHTIKAVMVATLAGAELE